MRIAVRADGAVIVTAPHFAALGAIERFIARHVEWVKRHVGSFKNRTVIRARKAEIPLYKKQALAFTESRTMHFARLYGVEYGKVTIRAQKSRWGSCSRKGNLSFNYKIALLPREIADYIVVHEVCHLLQFDHSRNFWREVEKAVPQHKLLRAQMRKLTILFD